MLLEKVGVSKRENTFFIGKLHIFLRTQQNWPLFLTTLGSFYDQELFNV